MKDVALISGRWVFVPNDDGGEDIKFRVRLIDSGRLRVIHSEGMMSWQIEQAIMREAAL